MAAATGLVLPAEMETPAQHLFEIYGTGMSKGVRAKRFNREQLATHELIAVHHVGVGANMAYRKEALVELGGFDTALDAGTPAGGAGDLDMFHRVLTSGRTICYAPLAVNLIKSWARGEVPRLQVAHYALLRWGRWLLGRLVLGLLRRHHLPLRLLWAEFYGMLHAPFAYVSTYRRDRKQRARLRTRAGTWAG